MHPHERLGCQHHVYHPRTIICMLIRQRGRFRQHGRQALAMVGAIGPSSNATDSAEAKCASDRALMPPPPCPGPPREAILNTYAACPPSPRPTYAKLPDLRPQTPSSPRLGRVELCGVATLAASPPSLTTLSTTPKDGVTTVKSKQSKAITEALSVSLAPRPREELIYTKVDHIERAKKRKYPDYAGLLEAQRTPSTSTSKKVPLPPEPSKTTPGDDSNDSICLRSRKVARTQPKRQAKRQPKAERQQFDQERQ